MIRDYFNLNNRMGFNGNKAAALTRVQDSRDPLPMSLTRQLFMYFGVFIGVLFSTAVSHFRTGEPVELALTLGEAVASAVVAFVIVPVVYEKLRPYSQAPLIVQFGLFVQNGVFWHVLTDLIVKGVL